MTTETLKAANPESLFLEHLRASTSEAHHNLERIPVSGALLAPTVSLQSYIEYLQLMHTVVSSLEKFIYPKISAVISDLPERSKLHKIEADLAYSGSGAPTSDKNVFSDATDSLAYALGIAYVVEGSALGGRFILKNINAVLGFEAENGASYFAGYGSQTGSQWKRFLSELTAYAVATSSQDDIVSGANFAFGRIHQHLEAGL